MNKKVVDVMKRTYFKAKRKTIKHAPELYIAFGIGGIIVSGVLACVKTMELPNILEANKEEVESIRKQYEENQTCTEETEKEKRKEITKTYVKTGFEVVKLYAFPVVLGATSLTFIGVSHHIMKKRNAGLAAYAATLDNGFRKYRERVIEKYGEEAEKELRYGIKHEETDEKVTDENGEESIVKKEMDTIRPDELGDFTRIYESGCNGFTKDPEHNKLFLRRMESIANKKLQDEGHVWLNDVLTMLGFPKTKMGHVVGWLYDPTNPKLHNCVDFGIHTFDSATIRFLNGYENVILLDFNVDGNIFDMM